MTVYCIPTKCALLCAWINIAMDEHERYSPNVAIRVLLENDHEWGQYLVLEGK